VIPILTHISTACQYVYNGQISSVRDMTAPLCMPRSLIHRTSYRDAHYRANWPRRPMRTKIVCRCVGFLSATNCMWCLCSPNSEYKYRVIRNYFIIIYSKTATGCLNGLQPIYHCFNSR